MTVERMFLEIAKDEAETLGKYQTLLEDTKATDEQKKIVKEIMGDEFNHCLIALIAAAQVSGLQIATDDITPNPNNIEVE